jgi:hypothetical protein
MFIAIFVLMDLCPETPPPHLLDIFCNQICIDISRITFTMYANRLENDAFLELHSPCMLTDWKTIYNLKVFGSKKIKGHKKNTW